MTCFISKIDIRQRGTERQINKPLLVRLNKVRENRAIFIFMYKTTTSRGRYTSPLSKGEPYSLVEEYILSPFAEYTSTGKEDRGGQRRQLPGHE